jgi:hypothetical protein
MIETLEDWHGAKPDAFEKLLDLCVTAQHKDGSHE